MAVIGIVSQLRTLKQTKLLIWYLPRFTVHTSLPLEGGCGPLLPACPRMGEARSEAVGRRLLVRLLWQRGGRGELTLLRAQRTEQERAQSERKPV